MSLSFPGCCGRGRPDHDHKRQHEGSSPIPRKRPFIIRCVASMKITGGESIPSAFSSNARMVFGIRGTIPQNTKQWPAHAPGFIDRRSTHIRGRVLTPSDEFHRLPLTRPTPGGRISTGPSPNLGSVGCFGLWAKGLRPMPLDITYGQTESGEYNLLESLGRPNPSLGCICHQEKIVRYESALDAAFA